MICLSIPLFIIVAFLVLTLVIGIYFSRKGTTFREYAIGNKQFTTAALVATVLATFFEGGGLIRNVECVYDLGLWFIVILLLVPIGIWTISKLSLRMGPFMHHISIAETMGDMYGKYPRVMTVFVGICRTIIVITSQIIIMSQAIGICVTLANPYVIPILCTLLLIFYSTFGGVRAVTFTDIIQFVTFSIIIPLLCWFIFVKIGKPVSSIVPALQSHTKFQLDNLFFSKTHLASIVLLLLGDIPSNIVDPALMQRVYMASGPMQAQKVFSYAATFAVIIQFFIILIAVFTFVGAPRLSKVGIWDYITAHIPVFFKGFVAVSLLAMAMSTADSCLNACAVMVSHDLVKNFIKSIENGTEKTTQNIDQCQLKIARWTTLTVGLSAMLLTFRCKDLLKLMYWSLNCKVPILAAPFILAVFGFRGTPQTALIGMATGVLTILGWNEWVQPPTGIDGSFVAMLANGLAMLAAHYPFKQPEGAGWVGPDHTFIQMQQARARKRAAQKEAIKNSLLDIKQTLHRFQPSRATLTGVGFYVLISNLLIYFVASISDHDCWLTLQLLVGAGLLGYSTFVSAKVESSIGWLVGLFWVMGLAFCLPINVLWHWSHATNLALTLGISLSHLVVTLLVLPLYLGVSFLMATLCIAICLSSVYCTKTFVLAPSTIALLLLFFLGLSLIIFGIFVYLKTKNNRYLRQVTYLKGREAVSTSRQFKSSLYDLAMVSTSGTECKGNGSILAQAVHKVEQSISFLDSNMPLYKQDFQCIIHKLYDWVSFFTRKEKAKDHALLQPIQITLDQLVHEIEFALLQEVFDPPRLLVEKIDGPSGAPSSYMVCDIHQVVYMLAQAVLRVGGKLDSPSAPIVRIQLHKTSLQFEQADAIDGSTPPSMRFQAIAFVIGQSTLAAKDLPLVKTLYHDFMHVIDPQEKKEMPPSIDLQQDTISSMVRAHYGYIYNIPG